MTPPDRRERQKRRLVELRQENMLLRLQQDGEAEVRDEAIEIARLERENRELRKRLQP